MKCHVLCFQTWNHFSDNEAERVKMMEEVEKLCDRLELARWVDILRTPAEIFWAQQ